MTVEWLLRALLAGALLGVAALAAERVAAWFGRPRRWTWAAAMAGSLLLPVLSLAAPGALPELGLPGWAGGTGSTTAQGWVRMSSRRGTGTPPSPFAPPTLHPAHRPLSRGVRAGWTAAALAMLFATAWSHARLRAVRRRCVPAKVEGEPVLIAERAGPMVMGLRRPAVVLPRWVLEAPSEERRLIVAHEREHVRGGDARLLALATLAVAAMPWNLPLWWQHRRLRLAVETDCDARVLAAGANRRLYGEVLLRAARRPAVLLPGPVLAWGDRSSHLRRRILAMTETRPRRPLLRALPLAAVVLALAAGACDVAGRGRALTTAPEPRMQPLIGPDGKVRAWVGPDGSVTPVNPIALSLSWGGSGPAHSRDPGEAPRSENYPVVTHVGAGAYADRAGIKVGDVIVSVDGRDLGDGSFLPEMRLGETYMIRVRRGGEVLDLSMLFSR